MNQNVFVNVTDIFLEVIDLLIVCYIGCMIIYISNTKINSCMISFIIQCKICFFLYIFILMCFSFKLHFMF